MVPGLRDRRSVAMATLTALVSGLDAELRRLGYKDSTLVWYRGCWRRLARFFAVRGVEEFSLDVGSNRPISTCSGSPRCSAITRSTGRCCAATPGR